MTSETIMRGTRTRRRLAAILLGTSLSASSGCAHHQLTNKQIAIGAAVAVGVGVLVVLAVSQCHKGANYCDNSPAP